MKPNDITPEENKDFISEMLGSIDDFLSSLGISLYDDEDDDEEGCI